jgi:hypothetical protein
MTTSTSSAPRRVVGGFMALIGGALMIVSVFLPWLDTQGEDPTGWDTYTTLSDAGRNIFYEHNFYASGFSPFFSGLTIMIAGGLLALIGLVMLASLRGGVSRLPKAAVTPLMVVGLLIFVVAAADPFSLLSTGPGRGILDPGIGLYLVPVGALLGEIGIVSLGIKRAHS